MTLQSPTPLEDELSVISAIYSSAGEFEFISTTIVRVNLGDFSITFDLPKFYPMTPPNCSVSSDSLKRDQVTELTARLADHSNTLTGLPMLLDLITWTREDIEAYANGNIYECSDSASDPKTATKRHVLVFEIDHIRDRKRYLDHVKSWIYDLGLWARLFVTRGRIVLLVIGDNSASVKNYEKRHRTVRVDVDSKGKPCKERMIKVLIGCQVLEADLQIPTGDADPFMLVECDDVRDEFERLGLGKLFKKCR